MKIMKKSDKIYNPSFLESKTKYLKISHKISFLNKEKFGLSYKLTQISEIVCI